MENVERRKAEQRLNYERLIESMIHEGLGESGSAVTLLSRRITDHLMSAMKRIRQETIEECAKVAENWARERGLQFGCDGSSERSGARHHGIGTKDCPRHLHHHHDDRCVGPSEAIRQRDGGK